MNNLDYTTKYSNTPYLEQDDWIYRRNSREPVHHRDTESTEGWPGSQQPDDSPQKTQGTQRSSRAARTEPARLGEVFDGEPSRPKAPPVEGWLTGQPPGSVAISAYVSGFSRFSPWPSVFQYSGQDGCAPANGFPNPIIFCFPGFPASRFRVISCISWLDG